MSNAKWTKNSGFARNRNVGTTRLKGDGGQIKPIETINGKTYNGYALNVIGSNLVFGLGTSTPFSRLSFGNNTNSGIFDINDTGQMAGIALNETSSGGKFSGFFYNSDIKKYYQPINPTTNTATDISTNGIQFMTTDINNFNKNDKSGGLLFITNENVTTIGGQPRIGINEGNTVPLWKGIDVGEDPDISVEGSISGVKKIVLDVRGSIRTDGYINFFHQYYENDTVKFAPSGPSWRNNEDNIPIGSLWLQEAAGNRTAGLYWKNAAGDIKRVEARDEDDTSTSIDRSDALSFDMFNFLFRPDDYINSSTQRAGEFALGGEVNYPYVILKGKGSGQGKDGIVGGTALNIRGGNPQSLQNIVHQKGYNDGSNEREIFSVTKGNISVTGLSGEELLIKPHNSANISDDTTEFQILKHPMKNFYSHHDLLETDASGGKIWCERQLLIGPKKADINWGIIDIQTTPNSPTLLSYNLNKNWNYHSVSDKINRRFITYRATNSIILLNKDQNHTGANTNNSTVGQLYDCSNSIIIGDSFKNLDIPKSLVINVNTSLNTENGQEIYDNIGGSIVSGYKNMIYSSPYSLVIGKDNFIHNNTITDNGIGNNIISGEGNEVWSGKFNSITGETNKVSGNYNSIFGKGNRIGYFDSNLTKTSKRGNSAQANDFYQKHNYNTVLGGFNKLGIQNNSSIGINYRNWYSFMAGSFNRIDTLTNAYNSDGAYESVVALGTGAYVGGDLRFAFGMNGNANSNPTSSNNQNVFVIDCSKNFGLGFGEPIAALNSTIMSHDAMANGYSPDMFDDLISNNFSANLDLIKKNKSVSIWLSKSSLSHHNYKGIAMGTTWSNHSYLQSMHLLSGIYMPYAINPKGGNVGIGELDPDCLLTINGGIGVSSNGGVLGIRQKGDTYQDGITLTSSHSNSTRMFKDGDGDFHLFHDSKYFTFRMNGRVGIGTTSPHAKLEVKADNDDGIMLTNSSNARRGGFMLSQSGHGIIDLKSSTGAANVVLNTSGNSWFNGGNVGIGTNDPRKQFHIKCANGAGIGFGDFTGSTTSPGLYFSGTNSHMNNLDEPHIWVNDPDNHDNLSFLCKGRHIWYNQSNVNHDGTTSERMTLLANGNLGIGYTSPNNKLDVNGTMYVNNDIILGNKLKHSDDSDTYFQFDTNMMKFYAGTFNFSRMEISTTGVGISEKIYHIGDPNTYFIFPSNDTIGFATSSAERMRIDSAGKVGIGETSPQELLHIKKSGNNNFIRIDAGNTGQYDSGIKLYEYETIYGFRMYYDSQHDKLHIAADNSSTSSNKVTVLHSGNVGIGTTSPGSSYKLDVNGDMRVDNITLGSKLFHDGDPNTYLQYSNDQMDLYTGGSHRMTINSSGVGVDRLWHRANNDNNTHIEFGADIIKFTEGGVEVMRVHNNSCVGIGTPSPGNSYKLDVRGCVRVGDGSTAEQDIQLISKNGNWQVGTNNGGNGTSSNQFFIYDSSYRLTVQKGTGNVGIGTATPAKKLDVNGDVKASTYQGSFPYNSVDGPFVPIGTIIMWPGTGLPPSDRGTWLRCDGSSFNQNTYPTLYSILGTTTLPNLKDRYPRGNENMTTQKTPQGGSEIISNNNLPVHNHNFSGAQHTHNGATAAHNTTHHHGSEENTQGQENANHSHGTNGHYHAMECGSYGGNSWGVTWIYLQSDTNGPCHNKEAGTTKGANAGHSHEIQPQTSNANANHAHNFATQQTTVSGNISNAGTDSQTAFQPKYFGINFIIFAGYVNF